MVSFSFNSIILNCVDYITCGRTRTTKTRLLVTRYVTGNDYYRKRLLHPSFSDETIIRTVLKFRTVEVMR